MFVKLTQPVRWDGDADWCAEIELSNVPGASVVYRTGDKATAAAQAIQLAERVDAFLGPVREAPLDTPSLNLAVRVAVEPVAIRRLVEDAAKAGWTLVIDYIDARGDKSCRRVIPSERGIFKTHVFGEGMIATRDLDKNEPRTFRIDRIQRAELAE